ncbi:SRPBCC family protein [Planococcus citreus]|uniref:Polyketide cyclase/dehydrase/lipid transport protein n=1 Tax=Planococcus citreus TaxID=1373 RepID=A0A497YJY6_9BACL|nr:SRPBCC family protein [Planococcus citreus]RLJ91417.1 polyketide cyclase/dehydrase/lipid transport protein [Planococcus citreus]
MASAHQSIFIQAPIDEVFQFAKKPGNWTSFYNHLSKPDRIEGTGEAGTEVETVFSIVGLRFPVTINVIRCERDGAEGFWEGIITGSFIAHQKSHYRSMDGGTEAVFELEIDLPHSAFDRFTERLVYDRLERNTLRHTLENLKAACELDR